MGDKVRPSVVVAVGRVPHRLRSCLRRHGLRQQTRLCRARAAPTARAPHGERTSRRARPQRTMDRHPGTAAGGSGHLGSGARRRWRATPSCRSGGTRNDYLLRCLLKCGNCGLGIHGCVFPGFASGAPWRYYRCSGKIHSRVRARRSARGHASMPTRLDQVVWDHVAGLLGDPERLLAQFERFAGRSHRR